MSERGGEEKDGVLNRPLQPAALEAGAARNRSDAASTFVAVLASPGDGFWTTLFWLNALK